MKMLLLSRGFLKSIIFYLRFRRSYGRTIAENNLLKKRLEESQANLAELQKMELQREKEVAENDMAAWTKIRDLESRLEASQVISKEIRRNHSTVYGKFVSAREEADRLATKLLDVTQKMVICRNKAESLLQSMLNMKVKFRKAKEKLHEYKEKA